MCALCEDVITLKHIYALYENVVIVKNMCTELGRYHGETYPRTVRGRKYGEAHICTVSERVHGEAYVRTVRESIEPIRALCENTLMMKPIYPLYVKAIKVKPVCTVQGHNHIPHCEARHVTSDHIGFRIA